MFDRLFTPPRDEKSLITAAKHDHRAFAELYERFVDVVYRFVRGQVSTRQDAEDIISETFVAVAHQIGGYDISREQKFTTRLLAIAKYKLLDSLRKVYTTPEMIEFTELNEPATDDDFLDLLDHRHL